ncbi:ABC transporter permease [Desmospora activa]|nr:ABC transporter permease [Desmospora activa]
MFKSNIFKQYIEFRRYLTNTLLELFIFYVILMALFLGFNTFAGQMDHFGEKIEYVVAGYLIWIFALTAMQSIGWEVYTDMQRGTMDQLYMTPISVWKILLSRMIGKVLIQSSGVALLTIVSMVTTGVYLNTDLISIIPILLLTLFSMFGIGFIVAGICILIKQVDNLLILFQFLLMSFVYIPIEKAPFLKYFPCIYGVDMLKQTMINHVSLWEFSVGDFAFLLVNSFVYFCLGVGLFRLCENTAIKKGILGKY